MKHKIQLLVTILLLNHIAIIEGNTQTGSSTAIGVQTATITYSTPNTLPTNAALAGAVMAQGFTLNAGAILVWSSCFPASGPITMNGQTVQLQRDFVFGGNASLVSGGNFGCAGYSVIFPHDSTSPFAMGSANFTIGNGNVNFNSAIALSSALTFTGSCVLDGGDNVISFTSSPNASIAVGTGSTLLIKNATLQGIGGTNKLLCNDSTGKLSLQNVTVILDSLYSFTQGNLNVLNEVTFTGSNVFVYQSTNPFTIGSNSTLMFDLGSTFSYDTTNASLLKFTDLSSELYLHGATLYVTGTGISLINGTLNIDENCVFTTTVGSVGITLGNGIPANDFYVNIFPSSQLTVTQGILNYNVTNGTYFNMGNYASILYMGNGTTLNLYKALNNGNGIVSFGNSTLGSHLGASITGSTNVFGAMSFTTF